MKKTIRRIAVLVLVMAMIVGICMPAFAAKPYVRLVSRPTSTYRARYIRHKYYLYSGSYTYRDGYRANYDGQIYKRSTGRVYSTWDINFTGRGYQTLKTYVKSSWPRGGYRTYVRCWYRSRGYGNWRLQGSMGWNFTVR